MASGIEGYRTGCFKRILIMASKTGDTKYENYVKDLGVLVKEYALEAKQQKMEKETDFSIGYMMGFHRMVSLMQQQAEIFNISLEKIGLDGIDADQDLL